MKKGCIWAAICSVSLNVSCGWGFDLRHGVLMLVGGLGVCGYDNGPTLNRTGFGGGFDSTERWGHASTEESRTSTADLPRLKSGSPQRRSTPDKVDQLLIQLWIEVHLCQPQPEARLLRVSCLSWLDPKAIYTSIGVVDWARGVDGNSAQCHSCRLSKSKPARKFGTICL